MAEQQIDGRARRYQHRRGELLDAVMEHVLEHGVTDLSLRPLARAVGVSHVTLRHHFGTKEELLAEVFDVIRHREPLPDTPPTGDEDLAALLRAMWRHWTSEQSRRHFLLLFEAYGQALREPERYRGLLDHVVDDWLVVIRALAERAGCPPAESDAFATVLLAQIRGLQLDLLTTGDEERVERSLELVIDFCLQQTGRWQAVR